MLKICSTFSELNIPALLDIYNESIEKQLESEQIERFQAEEEFIDYLKNDFFTRRGSFYAVLVKGADWVSALRAELCADGFLLSGLETRPDSKGQGYATELVQSVLTHLTGSVICAHVHKKNLPSLSVHRKCGFQITEDFAKLLDGTVSVQYYTLVKK